MPRQRPGSWPSARKDLWEDGIAPILRILEVLGETRLLEVHDVLAAARRRADEDHAMNDRRTVLRRLLGDHAAKGETKDVTLREAKAVEKRQGVLGHSGHRLGYIAARPADSGVLEEDDLSSGSERIGHRRIPVVERPGEVLQTEQRQASALAEAPVRVGMSFGLNELGGSRRVTRGPGR
jgi:hypothetical protein